MTPMPLITLKNLSLSYGTPPLLDAVNLHIDANERVCLLGRNGAGKSTLLRLINGEILADDLRAGRLVCPFKIPVRSDFQYYFVCPPTRLKDQAVKTFADWVSKTAKDSVAGLDQYIGTLT